MSVPDSVLELVRIAVHAHTLRVIAMFPLGAAYACASLAEFFRERREQRALAGAPLAQRIAALEARVADLEAETERLAKIVDDEIEAAEFWGDYLEEIANDDTPSEARAIAREALARQPLDYPERIAA